MDNVAADWVRLARMDLGVAQHLSETYHPKPLEIICYHCQQSAEKAVKAVLVSVSHGASVPRSHDVAFLLECVGEYVEVDEALLDRADGLTPYGVVVRYPNELFLEGRHVDAAISDATAILKWAEQIL